MIIFYENIWKLLSFYHWLVLTIYPKLWFLCEQWLMIFNTHRIFAIKAVKTIMGWKERIEALIFQRIMKCFSVPCYFNTVGVLGSSLPMPNCTNIVQIIRSVSVVSFQCVWIVQWKPTGWTKVVDTIWAQRPGTRKGKAFIKYIYLQGKLRKQREKPEIEMKALIK